MGSRKTCQNYFLFFVIAMMLAVFLLLNYYIDIIYDLRSELSQTSTDLIECQAKNEDCLSEIVNLEERIAKKRANYFFQDSQKNNFLGVVPTRSSKSTNPLPNYDLRRVLLLPQSTNDQETLKKFKEKWQVTNPLYESCGLTRSRVPSRKLTQSVCNIGIITSWHPRPCGIATYSSKLLEGLKASCPPSSRIEVIAVCVQIPNTQAPYLYLFSLRYITPTSCPCPPSTPLFCPSPGTILPLTPPSPLRSTLATTPFYSSLMNLDSTMTRVFCVC